MRSKSQAKIGLGGSDLVRAVAPIPTVKPKHDMRGIGYGDNGEGDEGSRVQTLSAKRQMRVKIKL